MKKPKAASHKDVSGFALLPSFLAGAITGLCGLGLCSFITTKHLKEELNTPVKLSFINSLAIPEVDLASDLSTEKEIIFDRLVLKKYQYRKFVTSNRRVPGAPLPPILLKKAAPILARSTKPIRVIHEKKIHKAELHAITEKLVLAPSRIIKEEPKKLEVYSALEPEFSSEKISTEPTTQSVDDEYSKMRSLRNTFVASLIGDMTDMAIQNENQEFDLPVEQPELIPMINEVEKEKISAPKKQIVAKAKIVKKKPLTIKRAAPLVANKVQKKVIQAPVQEPKEIVKISESEKLLQAVEDHLKQEVKKVEYSKTELKLEAVSTQTKAVVKSKEEFEKEIPVVIDAPKIEVTEEYVEPSIPVVQAAPEVPVAAVEPQAEPAPHPQEANPPLLVTGKKEEKLEKKESEPVVVARAWTLPPPASTKIIEVPAQEPVLVTIRPNPPAPSQPEQSEPKKESLLPVNPIGNIAGLSRTSTPTEEVPPAPPAPTPEKVCKLGVCFDRWLSKNNEQLDVLTYSLNKIPTQPNAKEWLLTSEERSVPTLYFGANLGSIPLINKVELEQTIKNVESEGFLLVRNNPSWTLVGSTSLVEENTISNSERAPGDKLYTKVQPGMLLVKVKNNETQKLAAVAVPILRGHVSFLDLTKAEEKVASVVLEKPTSKSLGIEWVGTDVLSAVKAGQSENSVKIQTFGNYPINVDVRALDGFTHRHLVFPNKDQVKLSIQILKDRQVERFLKMLEGGVSSDSGMVYGKIPLQYIGNNVRLDPGRASRKLIPELYFFDSNLDEEDQVLIPTAQATAKIRSMVGVQVPKGLLLISLEKPSGDRQAVQLHLSQPGIINVYQPE